MTMDCTNGFWCFQFKDLINAAILVVTLIAVFAGPVVAVKITLNDQATKEKRKRQYDIFHSLMKMRRIALAPERVMALNLVQLEFYAQEGIIDAYKSYMAHLAQNLPPNLADHQRFFEDREDLFFELISKIGKHLGYAFDKRDLDKFSYVPVGWNNDEDEIRIFRRLIIEVLKGERGFPISQFRSSPSNDKFPPPPT